LKLFGYHTSASLLLPDLCQVLRGGLEYCLSEAWQTAEILKQGASANWRRTEPSNSGLAAAAQSDVSYLMRRSRTIQYARSLNHPRLLTAALWRTEFHESKQDALLEEFTSFEDDTGEGALTL